MPIKIKDAGLKDKMMGYMKGKPEMADMMPEMENEGPAMETPEMHVEKMRPMFDSRSADEKVSFLSGLFGNQTPVAPAEALPTETPAMV